MEHFFSLLVRSIFVDNMIFAFFLGMCSPATGMAVDMYVL